MIKMWNKINNISKKILWIVVIIGLIASIPLTISKLDRESTANTVEFVVDYKDLLDIAAQQYNLTAYIDEELDRFKKAGITSFAVYESTLKDLEQANYLSRYSEREMASLRGQVAPSQTNSTYIVFASEDYAKQITPMIEKGFERKGVSVEPISLDGQPGLVISEPLKFAESQSLDFDPIAIATLKAHGFNIVPRFSDNIIPYDAAFAEEQLAKFKQLGVTRIIFEGENAKGSTDVDDIGSLLHFSEQLKENGIGITIIENIKKQQIGLPKIAYYTDYDVARLISLSDEDSLRIEPKVLSDRFVLAVKDRNIRIVFLNIGMKAANGKSTLETATDNVIRSIAGEDGAIARLQADGYTMGSAESIRYELPSYMKVLRMVVVVASVAMVALLISAFLPSFTLISFMIGLVGSFGLYMLNSSLLEQALALGVAVSGPTLGVIWIINRIYSRTFGARRMVGANNWTVGGHLSTNEGTYESVSDSWIFPEQPIMRRIGLAINWFVVGTVITLSSVPLIYSLLFHIKYTLVIEQFRGVSVLSLAPLALVFIYILFYQGYGTQGVLGRMNTTLRKPITILWVFVVVIIAAVGFYYLSRTGNGGQVSSIELMFRTWLENTFGVRPRFKEFVLGHPFMILGLFLALRYRASWFLIVLGAFGQLSMVSTFTHLHTPLSISALRTVLGLGFGVALGLLLVLAWIVLEGAYRKWMPVLKKQLES